MNLHLADKIFLVAGSSRGIGKGVASALLTEGSRVCITGRDAHTLSTACEELGSQWRAESILAFQGDLSETRPICEALDAILSRWGGLDGIVVNVGTGSGKPGWDQDEQEWERLLRLNFHAAFRLAQAAIPRLIERGGGTIVFISSIAGVEASPAPLPYCAAKAALLNYSKNLSRQLGGHGIRVNCIAPGNIIFPGGAWERHLMDRRAAVMEMLNSDVPMARFGAPEEIADLAVFLCSPRASFITGSCFIADGGQTRTI
ncbi:MAG: SDR family oxidoreductase [Bryobacteraceae bacterium]